MRIWGYIAFMAVVAGVAPAHAALTIVPQVVRSGYFQAPDCEPTADPKVFNECICEANIKKPQVEGIPSEVALAINQQLALLPEKLAAESCEGVSTTAPKEGIQVNTASADYELAYQSPSTLTMFSTYSTFGAGSAHPLSGTEGYTFDLATGMLIDPMVLLKPEQRVKADAFIKQELLKKYPMDLFDEAKTRTDPYLTENGCDTCTIFYGKDGWVVRFQIYSIAPYALGEPEVTLPADIIPPPETLMVKS